MTKLHEYVFVLIDQIHLFESIFFYLRFLVRLSIFVKSDQYKNDTIVLQGFSTAHSSYELVTIDDVSELSTQWHKEWTELFGK